MSLEIYFSARKPPAYKVGIWA